jgi:hypothetical protein
MRIDQAYRSQQIQEAKKVQVVNKSKDSDWIQYPRMINGRSGISLSDLSDKLAREFGFEPKQFLPNGRIDLKG